MRRKIEAVRVAAKARYPAASFAMMATERERFRGETRRHLERILARGFSVDEAAALLFQAMTGVVLAELEAHSTGRTDA
jgi:hypothetical protein